MKKTRIILLLFSVMQLAGINSISANTESGLHLTTSNLKVKADGKELCTAELQQAIDRIAAQGGGQLTFTPGRYLTGGLMLRSGVQLYLEEGATLLGSTDPRHYRLPNGLSAPDNPDKVTTYALIAACGVEHVTLAGHGTIDGQGLQLALTIDSLQHLRHPGKRNRRRTCRECKHRLSGACHEGHGLYAPVAIRRCARGNREISRVLHVWRVARLGLLCTSRQPYHVPLRTSFTS